MSYNSAETSLALQCLRAPVDLHAPNGSPATINAMRLKYRTYYVEYNVNDGAVMLPRMFVDDFGHQIPRYVYLIDAKQNQFEILVDKLHGDIYFTRGWTAIRNFYDIRIGAWLLLMYTGGANFGLIVEDRLHSLITPPTFNPPIKFQLYKPNDPSHFNPNPEQLNDILYYSHRPSFFTIPHIKNLTHYDISSGFLMLPSEEFGDDIFSQQTTSIKLVDECANVWDCYLIQVTFPFKYCNIGGQWSSLVAARRLKIGDAVKFGVEARGHNEVLYLTLKI
ncbi:linoleate 13S-lipoxygenase [Trifolium repens]|nr:linoleate 13S-lipoxygenase [Trifolium repens]